MGSILTVENLCKTYKTSNIEVNALKNISLKVEEGEFLAIMGKSGSGKSTFLNIIGTLDSPSLGNINIYDKKVTKMYEEPMATVYRSENIGFIFQDFNLLKDLTVEENIVLPLVLKGVNEKEAAKKTNEGFKYL